MRFSSTMGRRLTAVSVAMVALHGAQFASAQYAPYTMPSQGYVQPGPMQGYQPQQTAKAHQQPTQYQQQPTQYQQPSYQPAAQYTAMSFMGTEAAAAPLPAETVPPGPVQQNSSHGVGGENSIQAAPAVSYPHTGVADYGSYTYGGYNTFDSGYGYANYGRRRHLGHGCGCTSDGCATGNCCRRGGFFGGFYGLYMGRENRPWVPLAFSTLDTQPVGYYPADSEYVINNRGLSNDFQGGAEVRLGYAFGGGATGDPCGCSCGCGPRFGIEGGYWALVEDEQTLTATDLVADGNRLYGMIDFRGLQVDMGPGFRPLNHYFDYGPPSSDYTNGGALDEIQVRSLTARSNFAVQNVELNLLRLPLYFGGIGGYGGGAGCCGCGPRCVVTTLVGARYMRIDDDFSFLSSWENIDTPATGFAEYNVQVDNHLVGFQLGCRGLYRIGCAGRWALHCGVNGGIYGNQAEVRQFLDLPVGGVGEHITGGTFAVDTDDTEVAFIGELRVGGSYQYSCNWRLYGGYRAIGISGVALSFQQIPSNFSTPNSVSYVRSNGSIFLHGLQAGVERTF